MVADPTVYNEIVFKVFGNVTFSDGSTLPFDVTYQNGQLISPFGTVSGVALNEALADKAAITAAVLDLLPHGTTLVSSGTSAMVTDLTMSVSGRVSKSDGSWGDFDAQYSMGQTFSATSGNDLVPNPWYTAAIGNSTLKAVVDSVWEAMVGTGNATVNDRR